MDQTASMKKQPRGENGERERDSSRAYNSSGVSFALKGMSVGEKRGEGLSG